MTDSLFAPPSNLKIGKIGQQSSKKSGNQALDSASRYLVARPAPSTASSPCAVNSLRSLLAGRFIRGCEAGFRTCYMSRYSLALSSLQPLIHNPRSDLADGLLDGVLQRRLRDAFLVRDLHFQGEGPG